MLQYPAKDAVKEAEVDTNTACDIYRYFFLEVWFILLNMSIILCYVYRWLREVCSTTLLNMTDTIVQVDESLFRHKPKEFKY